MKDLIDSLTKHDIAYYAGLNPRMVKLENVKELLIYLGIDNVYKFGRVFDYKNPFKKFASIYRDIYVFGLDFETAKELAR